jgi:dTDP-4-dehydrorhamnose reductase
MSRTRVLLLGADGMLGRGVRRAFRDVGDVEFLSTSRRTGSGAPVRFDAQHDSVTDLLASTRPDVVINAIGLITQKMDGSPASVREAIAVNSLFPLALAETAERAGAWLIQIATDCVFSGRAGPYTESSTPDPTDPYGMTKSLGEAAGATTLLVRTSIIGPEMVGGYSLMGWLLSQPAGGVVAGYTNHLWSGVTTDHFGMICRGLVASGRQETGCFHIQPRDFVTKDTLLRLLAAAHGRNDITITPEPAVRAVDRRLVTEFPAWNARAWQGAGYSAPPSIGEMVTQQAEALRAGSSP